jgi:putative tricarboxylic transport membrane protein
MELLDGIDIVLVAVGLFAVAEVLYAAMYEGGRGVAEQADACAHDGATGSVPGPPGCAAPHRHTVRLHSAGGTEIPTFLSYATEKKLAKGEDKAEFGGKGAIEGVAGPEAANNATVTAR